ncbi:uncharacterized protein LOC142980464 [Anticarsia gemmatalis]|uniref:uncharacterized protein LOC142980464 n=1 Tax=Anticarsia gemmatalis TaxID=129554 RepID=UPI003F7630F0
MAQYNFEGDIDNLTEAQLQFINEAIKEQGIKNYKALFEPLGKAGDNYIASVKRINVQGENGTLNMIAKIAPTQEILWQDKTFLFFKNEHLVYTEILPKYVQLQKEAGIPEEEWFRYAKCYGSFTERGKEVLLLEDLNVYNYTMMDRFKPLSKECIKSVLKNLAILHSLSYVFREKDQDTYNSFKENLVDMWVTKDEPDPTAEQMKFFFQSMENDVAALMANEPYYVNIAKGNIAGSLNLASEIAKADKDSKYNVIIQGDAWTNNLLFKLEEGKDPASIMIDYQLSKSSSPVYDLIYLIFNGTDYESRKQNYYDWIDYYHSELDKSLSNFDLKVNFIYPRDRLDDDLKRYGKVLFGFVITLINVLVRKSEDVAEGMKIMEEGDLAAQAEQLSVMQSDNETKTRFRTKVVELIDSFKEFELL